VEVNLEMAWDSPETLILIAVVVVFLFGASRIPQFARALGSARREFDQAWRGITPPQSASSVQPVPGGQAPPAAPYSNPAQSSGGEDPIITAARNEGIVTEGKTRQQIASDLAWKLKQKESA
jgi:sec-independent protein translocase protein TatA